MKTFNMCGVDFQKITEQTFKKINFSELQFFIISQSGAIDTAGNIYIFTRDNAFFMNKNGYSKNFIDNIFVVLSEWNIINLYLCDFLVINPKIYNSFVSELCSKNIRDFWFETAIDIYKSWK